ncbi:hypothetical protein ENU1_158780 [Entamoeba nuttalli P19]|uniref:Ras-GEF domain-containing protein n=1 Tax=Entamoeba nuttalli (strain P19) TaxID=1076696 RepID=K2H838_ENTNP|nr:hypothetical protein ENU1_158780 [Entamoeba nuttalli P19]EKE38654.1 hypothetical protein ENU1_158780 [Entamoeba nuttalli P19]|eukprot:XP_008859012.1 hypothetical protein ENU1_158780 [Entamoeba nuttalli P19]
MISKKAHHRSLSTIEPPQFLSTKEVFISPRVSLAGFPSQGFSSPPTSPRNNKRIIISKSFPSTAFNKLNFLIDKSKAGKFIPQCKLPTIITQKIDECVDVASLVNLVETYEIYFIENIKEIDLTKPRMVFWRMEETHRNLFTKLFDGIKTNSIVSSVLIRFLVEKYDQQSEQNIITDFLNKIILNKDEIFSSNGDPVYRSDGNILAASSEVLIDLMFDINDSQSIFDIMLYSNALVMKPYEYVLKLKKKHLELKEVIEKESLELVRTKIEKAILLLVEINKLDDETKELIQEIFSDKIYSEEFTEKLQTCLYPKIEVFSLPQYKRTVNDSTNQRRRRNTISSRNGLPVNIQYKYENIRFKSIKRRSEEILAPTVKRIYEELIIPRKKRSDPNQILALEVINTDNICDLGVDILTQQFIFRDIKILQLISIQEVMLADKAPSIQQAIETLVIIEKLILQLIVDKSTFKLFIKIAMKCCELGDFNIGFIMYSCVVQISVKNPSFLNELKKSKLIFERLQELFSISKNHQSYREEFEKREPAYRIPILTIWIHDMLSSLEEETKIEYRFNVRKLKNVSLCIKTMIELKTIKIAVDCIYPVQDFLCQFS